MSTYKNAIENITKHITVLNVFKFFRCICSHYFLTKCSKIIMWPWNLLMMTLGVAIAYGFFGHFDSPHFFTIIEYLISLMLSIWTRDEYFYKYCRTARTNDLIFGRYAPVFDNHVRFFISIVFLTRFIIFIISSTLHVWNYYLWCINIIILNSSMNHLIMLLIFLILYIRMKYLRARLERNTVPVNIISNSNIIIKIREVRRCLIYYNNLLDNLHDISLELQCLILNILLWSLPKFIFFSYFLIKLKFASVTILMIVQAIDIVEGFLLLWAPVVVTEMTKNEVEKIKRVLSTQLNRCSDESLRFELEIALEYVTRRPFKLVVFRIVPVDYNIPLGIISLCITYVIVIIQFTRFNDVTTV